MRTPQKRSKSSPEQGELWSGVDSAVLAVADQVQDQFKDREVPRHQREWIAANLSLRQFWSDWLRDDDLRRVASGQLAANSLAKTRQALNRWERWTTPTDWPAKQPWPGLPVGRIPSSYVTAALEVAAKTVKPSTVRSTWAHLRTIFNHAVALKVLTHAPAPKLPPLARGKTQLFTSEQLTTIYQLLTARQQIELRTAFVLAVNAGMRPVDLFGLRWDDFQLAGRPVVTFTAVKTGKTQTVPLAPVTVAHLQLLPSLHGSPMLFPDLTGSDSKDPERSRAGRRRNAEFKTLLSSIGIRFAKPWQACRATCNERLESTLQGAGQFVLGHGNTLNSVSYREPSQLIYDAINTVPQPACFEVIQ